VRENIIVTAYEFIFSTKPSYRLTRHLVFWVIYCVYFYIQSLPPRKVEEFFIGKTYFTALMNLFVFAPVFIAATYFFIYYLLPKTIQKKKYILFITGFLLTYIIGTAINYFTAEIFLIVTGYFPNTFQHRIEMSNYNTRWGMIIATIALGIKLSKNWYLQQKENLEIIKRKARTEMQCEKAKIHPELLLRSLDTIYGNIGSGYNKAPSLILNLSEVLSYSLYENENTMVTLESELTQLRNLIILEQEKLESNIYFEMQLKGDTANKYVAPMILVKMLEQIITLLYDAEIYSCLLQLNLIAEGSVFFSIWSFKNDDENALTKINWKFFIRNAENRLSSYYARSDFNIKLREYQNEVVINLQIRLSKYAQEKAFIANTTETVYDNL
jgi:two-component system LytT family sensor kinase